MPDADRREHAQARYHFISRSHNGRGSGIALTGCEDMGLDGGGEVERGGIAAYLGASF